jgi:ribosomal-protein-alanine N-acetyltransferase
VVGEEICIRPLTENDIDAVMAIADSLPDAPHWPRSGYEAVFKLRSSPQRLALIAEAAGSRVAGFLIAALIAPQAELESIAVAGPFQRRGVARELIAALERELKARNCCEILLEVRDSNQPARFFYSAQGFSETARRRAYYRDPIEDAILMSRSVSP